MERGVVERVSNTYWPLAWKDMTLWQLVKVEGMPKPLVVHWNWFAVNGDLKPGDEIEFERSKPPFYQAVEGADHVVNLRVVKRAEEKPIEEAYEDVYR